LASGVAHGSVGQYIKTRPAHGDAARQNTAPARALAPPRVAGEDLGLNNGPMPFLQSLLPGELALLPGNGGVCFGNARSFLGRCLLGLGGLLKLDGLGLALMLHGLGLGLGGLLLANTLDDGAANCRSGRDGDQDGNGGGHFGIRLLE
jgi:hypothetical protein